ncbi:DUF6510 family protein [Pseudonocardia sp. DLS-67]
MNELDGNSVAGLLHNTFGLDMTAALGTCAHCGRSGTLAQARVYRTAGTVLRCPHCGGLLMAIIERGDLMSVDVQGLAELRAPA